MVTKKHTLIVGFAVCALALFALGAQKNSVERPFKINGHATVTITLHNGEGVAIEWGEATHMGRFNNKGDLHVDLTNPAAPIVTGSGVATAANGDKIFWVMSPGFQVTFTGGTERLENATGGFQIIQFEDMVVTHPDQDTMVEKFTYEGVGTITY